MAQLIILGSSNAIPTIGHENTHLAILTAGQNILIDCGANPVVRLEQAGIEINSITDIILTHFHPDHVSGLPLLLMDMWLMGRRAELHLYGLSHTLERAQSMMSLYGWQNWPNFFSVQFHIIEEKQKSVVFENKNVSVYASPVKHFIPNICLRIELAAEKKAIAYSCDTEPCQAVVDIAGGADILLHETAGTNAGHSSAGQAGKTARLAEARSLILIHYPTGRFASGDLVAQAKNHFMGEVMLAKDLLKIDL